MSEGWTTPPYPAQPPQPQRPAGGLPVWGQILIGAVAGPFVLGAAGIPAGVLSGLVDGSTIGGLMTLGSSGLPLLVLIAGLVWQPTRWYAVGTLISLALLFIVLAGVCIVLIAGMSRGTV